MSETNRIPIACDLQALSAAQRTRRSELAKALFAARQEIRDQSDGYAMRFTAGSETLRDVAEFVPLERLCCPFLRFAIECEPGGGPLWMKIGGGEEIKRFLAEELGLTLIAKIGRSPSLS